MQDQAQDERWMRLALSLAQRGVGRVWPNPAVGCVIVKDGKLLGRGWTQKAVVPTRKQWHWRKQAMRPKVLLPM